MENSSKPKNTQNSANADKTEINNETKYEFGGITKYSLEKIEEELLNEGRYLDVFAGSDLNFKENIQSLDAVLPLLVNLSCITYDYKNDQFRDKNFPQTRQVGVIANEVAKSFPELVKRDDDGYLHVNYSQLSTIAIQAVKELSNSLIETNERMSRLEAQIKKISEK
jgi:hypothetical protein